MALGDNAVRRLTVIATDQGLTALNTKMRENDRLTNQMVGSQTRLAAMSERTTGALLRQRDRLASTYAQGGASAVAGSAAFSAAPYAVAAAGVIATMAAMNAVWERGSQLLEKYAEAHRNVDRSDLGSNLEELGKFQTNKETAAQQQFATELGTRLQDANFQIEKFLKTSLDITDPALKLQSVWVGVVELIARGTGNAETMIDKLKSVPPGVWAGLAAGLPGVGPLMSAGRAASYYFGSEAPAAPTADQSMAAARGKLGSALETSYIGREGAPKNLSTFAGRFGDPINQLSKFGKDTKKEADEARNAWDRALESIGKHVAMQEAEVAAVGKSVGEHAKLRVEAQLLEAGIRSGMSEAVIKASEDFKKLADRAQAAAQALAEARAQSDLRFDLEQLGRSDREQGVASRLRSIYGDNYQSQMDGAIAQQIRFNEALKEGKEVASDFASNFARDMMNGVSASEALTNAARRLTETLIDLAIRKAAAGIVGNLGSMFSPGGGGGLGGGLLWQDASNQAAAAFPTPIGSVNAAVAHSGWFVGDGSSPGSRFVDASVFAGARRMHSGGLAGDEVPTILQKGERVIPKGGAAGGTQVQINVINQSGQPTTARETGRRQDGNKVVIDMVLEAVAGSISSGQGPVNSAIEGRYGLDRTKGMSA